MGKWILLIVAIVGLVLVTLFTSHRYIMLYVVIAGMVLAMLFAGPVGYWIERKVRNWQLRRNQGDKKDS